ncbi:hypothetical protein F5Y13DRAFT_168692 [Hypoxylon sp. FL1857]|nr:hypothetical protein F5Y13DRAFT_168692 [Hypoxylon sp. FL1857]
MRGLWDCSRCVGLMVLAILAPATVAAGDDEYQIHRLEKNHNLLRHPKRDASCQLSGYTLCPASVNGGCCPENYACGVSSCTATTAGPTSACGTEGYYSCPLTAGPGYCCPVGYICGRSCAPPAGVTAPQSCPTSYFGCTASPYGCCPDGMRCGSLTCYPETTMTFLVSDTVTTTNSRGSTITTVVTSTELSTPGPDPSATSAAAGGVPLLILSTVSKIPAIETSTSSSSGGDGGGLSSSQLGGIIGGAVALLVVIVAIAGVIIWKLKRTEKAAQAAQAAAESRHESSSGQQRSQKSGFGKHSVSEVDGTEADSYAHPRNAHFRTRSDDSTTVGERSPAQTPNLYGSNASTPPAWPGSYFAQLPGAGVSDGRQSSPDTQSTRQDNGAFPPRPSVESQGSHVYSHTRQWSNSNASELDGSIMSAHGVSELDTPEASEEAARRRSSSVTRTPKTLVRRTSDPSGTSRGGNGDGAPIGMALGTLPEISELHGHYGPPDLAVGQTAARLHRKNSSVSSDPGLDT